MRSDSLLLDKSSGLESSCGAAGSKLDGLTPLSSFAIFLVLGLGIGPWGRSGCELH